MNPKHLNDMQQLKALALAATPGPWAATHWNGHAPTTIMRAGTTMAIAETSGFGRDSSECAPDAAFMAAASPAVVLDLIARIERAAAPTDAESAPRVAGKGVHHWYTAYCEESERLKAARGCIERYKVELENAQRAAAPVSGGELDTDMAVFDMGLGFALCHRDFGDTRKAIKQLQVDFAKIRAAVSASQAEPTDAEPLYSPKTFDELCQITAPFYDGYMVHRVRKLAEEVAGVRAALKYESNNSALEPDEVVRTVQGIAEIAVSASQAAPTAGKACPSCGKDALKFSHQIDGVQFFQCAECSGMAHIPSSALAAPAASQAAPVVGDIPRYKLVPGDTREWMAPATHGHWCKYDDHRAAVAAAKAPTDHAKLMREAANLLGGALFQYVDTGEKAFDLSRRLYAALAAPVEQAQAADCESAWKSYAAARTPLLDTSHNRAIFAAGFSAAQGAGVVPGAVRDAVLDEASQVHSSSALPSKPDLIADTMDHAQLQALGQQQKGRTK